MKKIIILLLALLATGQTFAQQQKEDKRSQTQFAFPTFQDAKVLQPFGRFVKAKANILLLKSTLCYMEGDKVKEAYVKNILGVEFDSVKYVKVDSVMGRVIATKGYNQLVCVTTIDRKQYEAETQGGENLPYFFMENSGLFLDLDPERQQIPKGLPLKDKFYFICKGKPVPANESKIKRIVRPDMKRAFKSLMEDRWWSWKDAESLKQLLDYLPQ